MEIFNIADFFDKILRPVMAKIGKDWETGKLAIATEHVASNIAQTLVKIIMEQSSGTGKQKESNDLCTSRRRTSHRVRCT